MWEDQFALLVTLTRVLVGQELELHAAPSADGALALLQQLDFDVIISDDEMPGMSGTDLLAEVHRRFPDVIRIMYTGAATVERAARAINEGRIFQFLLKPCRPAEIIGVIHAALQEKRARETTKRALHAAKKQRRVLRELTREVEELAPIRERV